MKTDVILIQFPCFLINPLSSFFDQCVICSSCSILLSLYLLSQSSSIVLKSLFTFFSDTKKKHHKITDFRPKSIFVGQKRQVILKVRLPWLIHKTSNWLN